MEQPVSSIPYCKTGYFNQLVIDFLAGHPSLRPFYKHSPVTPDFEEAITAKKAFPQQRETLVAALREQYKGLEITDKVKHNIESLLDQQTFTITTAHQPNIFTGYLYFAYKILQTIKLADKLQSQYPKYNFVPVYYMGSEDADLDELGHVYIDGKTINWPTDQQGAVGKMRPEGFEELIEQVKQALGYGPYAEELIALLQKAYLEHNNIQEATLYLVNELFGRYGLVILVPDSAMLKKLFVPVMRDELLHQRSFGIVNDTIAAISKHHKVQANPREINLFYLTDTSRERIVRVGDVWKVLHSSIEFTADALERELADHPERFSPNVILRGMLQETILPNIAFIGGGGEIAYWLELQQLFEHYRVPYPVLILRNSFLLTDNNSLQRLNKLGLTITDLFEDTEVLINRFVQEHTNAELVLKDEYAAIEKLFDDLVRKATSIDVTLEASVGAERTRAVKSIGKLEHKFLRAEKKKFTWQSEQIRALKAKLFPAHSLQERKENFMPWYISMGPAFFDLILENMDPLSDQFGIIYQKD
ncbi:bacillithiol biosynthesis cysteine-adding enzyme BshC [Chitinophaga rhizophila]|uniref:Putative cysteine ligase BshC n=1 Tax=Chitinophaga rhizophila TaxID=2866212 RepID=A0ABS7GHZ5_9BACT|nr:bacillithiol biosynthesis cysteine-adding enzyme BshC [Chitinophaga rhizophila]MBW8687324.1 bacillithiol biosynthesis cysteine-adding enzyme BshC [Chitinophaga rhizophila]